MEDNRLCSHSIQSPMEGRLRVRGGKRVDGDVLVSFCTGTGGVREVKCTREKKVLHTGTLLTN